MKFFLAILLFFAYAIPVKADINWEIATVEDVQEMIKTENKADENFLTQLLIQVCAKSRNLDIIDELIRLGAKIDKRVIQKVSYDNIFRSDLITLLNQGIENIDKETLKDASIKQHLLMQKLFEKRIDKDVEPNFGLEEWWDNAAIEDIQKEIDSGADINGVYKGYTPLQMALIMHRGYNTVKFLIDNGADVNGETTVFFFVPLSQIPLKIAIESSSFDVVELLLKSGANVHISEKYEQGLLFDLCKNPFENEKK